MTAATGKAGAYRLVIYGGAPPTASVFALDATAFAPPLATMRLSPTQDLPVLEPGGVVQASEDFKECTVGDTVIRPVGRVVTVWPDSHGRIFAERGNVIVNPETPGWMHTWRDLAPESEQTVEQFERQAHRDVRAFRVMAASTAVFIVIALMVVLRGGRVSFYWSGAGSAGTMLLWRRARRSLRVLAAARARGAVPATPMLMRLRWVVGHGHGPMVMASLRQVSGTANSEVEIEVIGVPACPLPREPVTVDVFGADGDGLPGVIHWGETRLWPVSQSTAPTSLRPENGRP
jgi:hypothetical protein